MRRAAAAEEENSEEAGSDRLMRTAWEMRAQETAVAAVARLVLRARAAAEAESLSSSLYLDRQPRVMPLVLRVLEVLEE